ncbi:MAG: phosphodiester glycosidase family protein [Ignavibacteriales bacterium]|nr:phosphodiester glycosidase family protein [Ignavibacteriales bacterium]
MKQCAFLLLIFTSQLFALPKDSVVERRATVGVLLREYSLSGPNVVNVLEVDLRSPHLRVETYRPPMLTKLTDQVKRNSRSGHTVVAAVNADFFSFETGWPTNSQVSAGVPVLAISSKRSQIAIGTSNHLALGPFSFSASFYYADNASFPVDVVNTKCPVAGAAFYSLFRDSLTLRDSVSEFLRLRPTSSAWSMNDTVAFEVVEYCRNRSWKLKDGECLLGMRGPLAMAKDLRPGKLVKIFFRFTPIDFTFAELISGWGSLLHSGTNVAAISDTNEGLTEKFTAVRHPRTFAGFNADTTKLFLCTVDGRQAKSIGMTFKEMASFLLQIGATDGFNLDGGGSTEMVVNGEIINSPSDKAGERPVANSLQIICKD